MAVSKAQQKAVNKYMAANYDRINLTVAKGQRDAIKAHAETRSESTNAFINRAISETMERDSGAPEAEVVSLPPDTLKAAQEAAQAAGEAVPQFIGRAVETQAERDALGRKMKGVQNEPI